MRAITVLTRTTSLTLCRQGSCRKCIWPGASPCAMKLWTDRFSPTPTAIPYPMRRSASSTICLLVKNPRRSYSSAMSVSMPLTKSSTTYRASERESPPLNPECSMANRLLDRQVSLLEYLTSGAAIFGDKSSAPAPRPLRGFDSSLLQMEARFSYDKRMKKIAGIFPKTFAILGDNRDAVLQAFVETCPPVDISRIVNG